MRKETLAVGTAIFCGIIIGAYFCDEVARRFTLVPWLWSVGALVGGLLGWVAVDPAHFKRGVVRAFKESRQGFVEVYNELVAWKPEKLYWLAVGALMAGCFSFALTSASIAWTVAYLMLVEGGTQNAPIIALWFAAIVGSLFFVLLFSSQLPTSREKFKRDLLYRYHLLHMTKQWLYTAKYGNPVVFPVMLVVWFTQGLCIGARRVRKQAPLVAESAVVGLFVGIFVLYLGLSSAKEFVVGAFRYTYSAKQRLVFVHIALGSAVGHLIGYSILVAAIGAVLGMIEFELISVRLLKLVPAEAKE